MINAALIVETALLLLVAYLIGCFAGYGLRRLSRWRPSVQQPVVRTTPAVRPAVRPVQARPEPIVPPPALEPVVLARMRSAAARLAAAASEPDDELAVANPINVGPIATRDQPILPSPPPELPRPEPVNALPVLAEPPQSASNPSALPTPAKVKPPADPKPRGRAAPRKGGKDDLKKIKGIGPKIEAQLNEWGIFHLDQIAKLSRANAVWIDDQLGFKGRVGRENWIAQARAMTTPSK